MKIESPTAVEVILLPLCVLVFLVAGFARSAPKARPTPPPPPQTKFEWVAPMTRWSAACGYQAATKGQIQAEAIKQCSVKPDTMPTNPRKAAAEALEQRGL